MVYQILCLLALACLNSLPNALAQIQMLRCSNYQVIFIVQMHLFIILSTVAFYPVSSILAVDSRRVEIIDDKILHHHENRQSWI